jgi:hypothetical protein
VRSPMVTQLPQGDPGGFPVADQLLDTRSRLTQALLGGGPSEREQGQDSHEVRRATGRESA